MFIGKSGSLSYGKGRLLITKTQILFTVKSTLASLGWRRGDRFSCPVCNRQFSAMSPFIGSYSIRGQQIDHATQNAMCPVCNSDIRHRFMMTYIKMQIESGRIPTQANVLHFAPEPGIYRTLRTRLKGRYVAADLHPERFTFVADAQRVDITAIPFQDDSFDLIVCAHVLEHIEDDVKACAELFRVLKPGGLALIALPIYGDTTYEVPGLDEQGRIAQYGDPTHVRLNGLDFAEKLKRVGFGVQIVTLDDVPGNYVDRSVRSPHVDSDRYLFVGEKQPAS